MDRVFSLASLAVLGGCYLSHPPPAPPEDVPAPVDCGGGVFAEPEVCGDGRDQDCDGIDPPCPADVCPTASTTIHVVDLAFEDPGDCPWGEGDNGGTRDGVYRARTEQVAPIELPAGAVLCGLSLEVPDQEVRFDDELIVTFADAVLVESFRPEGIFAMPDGIPRYRWTDLRGHHLGENEGSFCLGDDDACALPDSEAVGRFALTLDGEVGHALGEHAIREGSTDVTVVTTGDNNRTGDCRHTPFTLRVTAEVVE